MDYYRSKPNASQVATLENEILRIDLQIEGYKTIQSVPIELGGVRSYIMEEKAIRYLDDSDEDESALTAESVPEEKKKSKKGNKE